MEKYSPLSDKVCVQVEGDDELKSELGLVIVGKQPRMIGKVLEIGPGKTLKNGETAPMEVKVGDRVIFRKYAGTEIKEKETETKFLFLNQDEILAVLED